MKPIAWVPRRHAGAITAIGTAGSLLLLGAGAAGAATHPPSPAKIAVAQGTGPAALNNAQVVGKAAASTQETVSFVLRARHLPALEYNVNAGTGRHLSVAEFASQYGQPSTSIKALEDYLAPFGITSRALPGGLDVQTTGPVSAYNAALGVNQKAFRAAAIPASNGRAGRPAVVFHGTAQPALLPVSIAGSVLAVLGLTNYPAGFSQAIRRPALPRGVQSAATQKGNLTPASFASRYGLNPLLARGAKGQGQTIGIVTLASLRPSDATHFWSSILKIRTAPNRITLVPVDGGAGPVSDAAGSGETTLDVEQSGALAPDASIIVYHAPNTDAGFLDAFATAASQNRASVVSASWGESEDMIATSVASGQESSTYARAFDEVFLEFAAQGQSSFVAAGDNGAYDASGDVTSRDLAIDNPGDSPWTTDAGGTTLPGTIPVARGVSNVIRSERAWGWDWLWPDWKKLRLGSEFAAMKTYFAGGGGGYSSFEPTPGYQRRSLHVHVFTGVHYLTPIKLKAYAPGVLLPSAWLFTGHPKTAGGTGARRAVPDVSADADPFTGYEEYFTGFSRGGSLQSGWGGTSFVAPQLAGATAVIDSYLHRRVGFLNPSIYRFATGKNSPFSALTTTGTNNDNLFYTGGRSRFSPATGLGTPNFAKLAADFRG